MPPPPKPQQNTTCNYRPQHLGNPCTHSIQYLPTFHTTTDQALYHNTHRGPLPSCLQVVLANPGTISHADPQLQRLHERLNELNRKVMAGEFDIPPEHERSPSPEPIYDSNGVRLNTREIRCEEWAMA